MTMGEIQAVLWARRRESQERDDDQSKRRMFRLLQKIKEGKK